MAIALPRFWFRAPRWQFWLVIGLVGILAAGYLQFRLPRASADDVSPIAIKPATSTSNRNR